jgi:glyceraldehyde-3-phosphate dehydrogenase/erythrose-4-phosphate dehydrogenase
MTRIAINGLGRIGRAAFKQIIEDGALELAAVNDLASAEDLTYLLKHDSVYGRDRRNLRAEHGRLVVNGHSLVVLNQKTMDKLPWRDLGVDIVLECTGVLRPSAHHPPTPAHPRSTGGGQQLCPGRIRTFLPTPSFIGACGAPSGSVGG